MLTASTPGNLIIGAGDVYVDDQAVGATEADNLFRVTQANYHPKLNGIPGPVMGTDYVTEDMAELEVTVPELGTQMQYGIPNSIATPGDAAGTPTGGGAGDFNTTLAAASVIGATNVKLAAVATLAIGDEIEIGAAGSREFRVVTAVGTAGGAGTGVDFLGGLTLPHGLGDAVVRVASTILAQDAPMGSTTLKVASVLGLAIGVFVRFGYPGEEEVRLLTFVGTAGAGGTGIQFGSATNYLHRAGDALMAQTTSGQQSVSSNSGVTRRLPLTAYHKWELRVLGLNGMRIFTLRHGICIDAYQVDTSDGKMTAPRLKIQSRWDAANPTVSPWSII